ncbi:hypothetical protein [Phyllobacterium lublinensis]|uniref:hypothetical protein n=1 Tax=Phyllobacterium lublinensis TaxID=2875708 RepID=UPI001CCB9DE3|nr:hypothetical protein [Phyllobacterium sp. 2063]MBZ9655198.1 hypothetical protein [Phyllobacterium sp. 2063]
MTCILAGTLILATGAIPAAAEGISVGGSRNGGLGLGARAGLGSVKTDVDASVGGSKGIDAGAAASVGGAKMVSTRAQAPE